MLNNGSGKELDLSKTDSWGRPHPGPKKKIAQEPGESLASAKSGWQNPKQAELSHRLSANSSTRSTDADDNDDEDPESENNRKAREFEVEADAGAVPSLYVGSIFPILYSAYTAWSLMCDAKLARIFGGKGAVVGTIKDPPTLKSLDIQRKYYADQGKTPPADYGVRDDSHGPVPTIASAGNPENRGGIFHIYGNAQGDTASTGLYAPAGGKVGGLFLNSKGNTQINVSYKGGLVLTFLHVTAASGGPNAAGSVRIGNISGPGGDDPGYLHTHVITRINGKEVDPRKVYCQ